MDSSTPPAGPPADQSEVVRLVEARRQEEEKHLADKEPEKERAPSDFVLECLQANEYGDGLVFAELQRGKFLYNTSAGEWLSWAGHHWERDLMLRAPAAVEDVALRYLQELFAISRQLNTMNSDDDEKAAHLKGKKKQLRRRIERLRSIKGRNNCLQFAYSSGERPLAVSGDDIDQRPWLLACKNGVVDLRTGRFRKGQPEDYLLRAAPTNFPEDLEGYLTTGKNTPCPNWEKTLEEVFGGSRELVNFVQRLAGYAITGLSNENIFPVFTGKGRNGKGLVVETINKTLGTLSGPIPAEMLLDQGRVKNSTGPSPDIMALRGLRFGFASETDDGRRVSPSRVKWLTGGDTLVGRNPHDKHPSEFVPTHTLFLLTNHKPHAPADDFAFWQRLLVVPFNLSFVSNPQKENERLVDKNLPEKLLEESSGVLAWLVRGCLLWQKQGLNPPPEVQSATEDYRREEDWLADWLDDCCIVDEQEQCGASQLYEAFEKWYEKNISKKVPSQRAFGKKLGRRFKKEKKSVTVYAGLALKDDLGLF